jgi:CO/xanthine dehydrogenase Mo-binding subunit
VKKNGILVARQMRVLVNCGAYDICGAIVARSCAAQAVDTYRIPNFEWDSYSVYTNTAPPNTFRSVGSTEMCWAIENQMDILAEKLGIDPVEIRAKNILKEGEFNSQGEIVHSIGQEECLKKAANFIKTRVRLEAEWPWLRGKGVAIGNMYSAAPSVGVAKVKVIADGSLEVYHGGDELGQGCTTVMAQIGAEEFGIDINKVKVFSNDTLTCPFLSYGSTSSRTTFIVGNAVILACQAAKRNLFEKAALRLGVKPSELETKSGEVYVKATPEKKIRISDLFLGYYGIPPGAYGEYTEGGEIIGTDTFVQQLAPMQLETGQMSPELAARGMKLHAFYAYLAKVAEVAVNVETGQVKVLQCFSVNDIGRAINPKMVEQQAESGVVMGIGDALYEELVLDKGVVLNPNFTDYKIPTFVNVPLKKNLVTDMANAPHKNGPYGAKGFGEGAMVGMEGAIANAIYNAVGVRIYSLPITPEKVLEALKEKALKGKA